MNATLPKTIGYRDIALAYESEVLSAWSRLRAIRFRRDLQKLLNNEAAALRLGLEARESKLYLLELLTIRQRARKAGR